MIQQIWFKTKLVDDMEFITDQSQVPLEGYKEGFIFCKQHLVELVDEVKDMCELVSYGTCIELEKSFSLKEFLRGNGVTYES